MIIFSSNASSKTKKKSNKIVLILQLGDNLIYELILFIKKMFQDIVVNKNKSYHQNF